MSGANVKFYFDFLSPYSYIAFVILCRLKERWNLTIDWVPVRLPHIVKTAGNVPPASCPPKAVFLGKDLMRTATMYGIPLVMPPNFLQIPTKAAGLVVTAAKTLCLDVEGIVQVFWDSFFGIGDASMFTLIVGDLEGLLSKAIGEEKAKEIITLAGKEETHSKLYDQTDEALNVGAFGAPTMIITMNEDGKSEFFFGSDRFHHIALFLTQDPRSIFDLMPPIKSHL